MTGADVIQTRIDQCLAKIAQYERALREARAELSAYTDALSLVGKVARAPRANPSQPDVVGDRVRAVLDALPPDGSSMKVDGLLRVCGLTRNEFAAVTRSEHFAACARSPRRGSWCRRLP